jgi:putative transposase
MFACYLVRVDRQVYYQKMKRKVSQQAKATKVISMDLDVKKSMPGVGTQKS